MVRLVSDTLDINVVLL